MEWDTAAAHAILNSLGYAIYKLDGQLELEYNKQNLLNPHFICY
jgi:3'(2'), 5'-bisphosphate nucleotidase